MKKIVFSIILAGTLMQYGCFSGDDATVQATTALTMKTSVTMSAKASEPAVVDSTQSVSLEFSSAIDTGSISGEIKLYKVKATGETVEEQAVVAADAKTPSIVTVSKKDGTKFTEGEEYKIAVSNKVRTAAGATLGRESAGYFAVNYSFNLDPAGIADLSNTRSLIVCISDIHLGFDLEYSEIKNNDAALTDFLGKIRVAPNVKELVIAGDLFDEWFIPGDVDTFEGKTQADFVARIAAAHKSVIDAFKNIINDGKIKVTYVPGNHDILITASDVESVLPGISQARDVAGLGTYSPADRPEIAFEHGHRYNYFCAPDPISNRSITGNTTSIMPPGYFFTRIATTSVVERKLGKSVSKVTPTPVTQNSLGDSQLMLYYYYQSFKGVLADLPVAEAFTDKFIKTNIDGFTATYAMSDIFPFQTVAGGVIDVNLFKGAQDTWDQRQTANLVPVNIPVKDAILNAAYSSDLDAKSDTQYFKNAASNKRIVVFGHSHVPLVKASSNTKSQKTIYANAGTWIDHNPAGPTMDFVVIAPQKTNAAAPHIVNAYSYSASGAVTRIADPQAITNIQ